MISRPSFGKKTLRTVPGITPLNFIYQRTPYPAVLICIGGLINSKEGVELLVSQKKIF